MASVAAAPALARITRCVGLNRERRRLYSAVTHFEYRCHTLIRSGLILRHDRLSLNVALADDGGNRAQTLGVGLKVGDVKKARLVQSNVDERRLHSGQYSRDTAFIDVAG